ncbi:hypothetical protein CVT25_001741 [Psilocybe cyanescens]|uniref:Uncharacterized protein n=1 Tax=Psilocybe cyanescens TaxID=93625 RepID=A0A409XSL1_PSICY|nr:hypothetical protein CVT25_001741 [Psilocybe cyanescens]
MANLMRSAKSSSDWSGNELLAFNIRVVDAGIAPFFNTTELPQPTVSTTILANIDKPDAPLMKDDRLFFQYMKMVEKPRISEFCVNDFAAFLLRITNHDESDDQDRVICQRTKISFPMVGQRVEARVDGDKRFSSYEDPEPHVIAGAIAAFYQNNLRRRQSGLPPLPSKYIPAITMIGTAPIFYRILVTTTLLEALAAASYPREETTVLRFIPSVPNQERYLEEGMHPIVNRHAILQCFEGFKAVIN